MLRPDEIEEIRTQFNRNSRFNYSPEHIERVLEAVSLAGFLVFREKDMARDGISLK